MPFSAIYLTTPDATTLVTSLLLTETLCERVRHFDGTVQATAEWTHRNALAPLPLSELAERGDKAQLCRGEVLYFIKSIFLTTIN
jgi:hypothetical protein